jgi:hypothetical protein
MITSGPLGEQSRLSSRLDERLQDGFQRDSCLSRARLGAPELDPPLVEAIKHLDARCEGSEGMVGGMRAECFFPLQPGESMGSRANLK